MVQGMNGDMWERKVTVLTGGFARELYGDFGGAARGVMIWMGS
jgi:hypothetical protein